MHYFLYITSPSYRVVNKVDVAYVQDAALALECFAASKAASMRKIPRQGNGVSLAQVIS